MSMGKQNSRFHVRVVWQFWRKLSIRQFPKFQFPCIHFSFRLNRERLDSQRSTGNSWSISQIWLCRNEMVVGRQGRNWTRKLREIRTIKKKKFKIGGRGAGILREGRMRRGSHKYVTLRGWVTKNDIVKGRVAKIWRHSSIATPSRAKLDIFVTKEIYKRFIFSKNNWLILWRNERKGYNFLLWPKGEGGRLRSNQNDFTKTTWNHVKLNWR